MGRRVQDDSVLAEWLATAVGPGARQYASVLRPLLRAHDALALTTDDLLEYVLRETKPSNRRRTVSALKAFFWHLRESGRRGDDPAYGLDRRIRDEIVRSDRRAAMVGAGVGDHELEEVCWSSVLSSMIGKAMGGAHLIALEPLPPLLEEAMLRRLGGVDAGRFRSLMRERVS